MEQSSIPPTTVLIDPQSTALNVMEASVVGFLVSPYSFSATYFGTELGYFIDKIDNVASDTTTNCFWIYYIISATAGGGVVSYSPNVGVSNFLIPATGTRMVWRYQFIPPGNHTTPESNTASNSSTPDALPSNSTASNSSVPEIDPTQFVVR